MMEAFKDTQAGVQGLYPETPASDGDPQYVPFIAATNTCYLSNVPWNLPTAIIENLRDLVVRETKRNATDTEMFVPVLCLFNGDQLLPDDFTYSYNSVDYPVFTVPTMVKNVKRVWNEKTSTMVETLVPETPINLVDGSSSSGMVSINDPAILRVLAGTWDDWLKTKGLTTYSMTVGPFSAEHGINVLFSGSSTRHWIGGADSTSSVKPLKPRSNSASSASTQKIPKYLPRDFSTRFTKQKHKAIMSSPFATKMAVADTFQSVPLTEPYNQIMSTWILPAIENESIGIDNSTLVPRWQALMKEPFLVNDSTGFDGESLSDIHYQYAHKMLKSRTSPDDIWDNFFVEMAKQGRGGILSSLVASAVGSFFPQAASAAQAIASVVPF